MRRRLLGLLLIAAAGFGLWLYLTQSDAPPAEPPIPPPERGSLIGRFPRSQFHFERDRFLPATDPRTVPASRAHWLEPDDEVFGVVVDGHARAYPIPMIAYHHVVNDVIRGIPIAVTY